MSLLTPSPARQIDPRGQRFGAAVSAVILGAAFAPGPAVAGLARRPEPGHLRVPRDAPVPARPRLADRQADPAPWAHRTRARVPAPVRPGPGGHVPRAGRRCVRASAFRFSAGCSWLPSPACRPCSRPPGSAWAAASTSCAGSCPPCSRGCSGAATASRRSRCRRSIASADRAGASSEVRDRLAPPILRAMPSPGSIPTPGVRSRASISRRGQTSRSGCWHRSFA